MNGWMVLVIVLCVGLLVAIYEGVAYADQNVELRVRLDRAVNDRDASARAHTRRQLRDVVTYLRIQADCTADRALWRAYQDVARHIEREHIGVAGFEPSVVIFDEWGGA